MMPGQALSAHALTEVEMAPSLRVGSVNGALIASEHHSEQLLAVPQDGPKGGEVTDSVNGRTCCGELSAVVLRPRPDDRVPGKERSRLLEWKRRTSSVGRLRIPTLLRARTVHVEECRNGAIRKNAVGQARIGISVPF